MQNNLVSRLISALVMAFLLAEYVRHDYARWALRGREAFLAHEDRRFSRWMSKPHLSWSLIIADLLLVILFLALYELVAWGIAKALVVTQKSAHSQ